jgi:prevent-host-death family protein
VKTVSATEFKAKCLQLLDKVQRTGEDLLISQRGKPVARVVAENAEKPWLVLRGTGAFSGDPFAPALGETEIEALN